MENPGLLYSRCSLKLIHCVRRWFGFGSGTSCAADPGGSPALGAVRKITGKIWMVMMLGYFYFQRNPDLDVYNRDT